MGEDVSADFELPELGARRRARSPAMTSANESRPFSTEPVDAARGWSSSCATAGLTKSQRRVPGTGVVEPFRA
jgi:hypothetical protein